MVRRSPSVAFFMSLPMSRLQGFWTVPYWPASAYTTLVVWANNTLFLQIILF
jgi:hypothetical protein